jgi:energy-converting hydrogenase Eha subunit B
MLVTDEDYRAETITTYPINKYNAKDMMLYSADVGFTARFAVTEYPTIEGGDYRAFVHDNGGGGYNKCYFAINSNNSPAITAGTLWKSKTEYNLQMTV